MRNGLLRGITALLFVVGMSTVSSAATFILTSDGLGMREGNHGSEIQLDGVNVHAYQVDEGQARGTDGILYLGDGSQGLGIRAGDGTGETQISGDDSGQDRLEFDLSGLYDLSDVSIGLSWFDRVSDEVSVEIIGTDGTLEVVNQDQILSAYEQTGRRSGVIRIDDLLSFRDVGTIQSVSVQSRSGDFWVNSLSATWTSNPVPDPASLWLLGTGLVGLAGWRRTRGKRA